jgi:cell division protein FtsQ
MSPTITNEPETQSDDTPKIIDPKFRARRVAVKRAEGRRRLRLLLGTVVFATVAGGLFLLTQSSVLDVDRIDVIGSEHTPAPLVGQVSQVKRGTPLVWTNRGAVAHRVEALPWVARAHVGFALPGRLRIVIDERTPVATTARPDGSFALIDKTARVLTVTSTRMPGLPEIVGAGIPPGPAQSQRGGRSAIAAVAALPAELKARVVTVDVAGGLTVKFNGGPEARLGSTELLSAKVAALQAVLADLAARNQGVSYVDVRVPNAPVVG